MTDDAEAPHLQGERKRVTIMFADLSGFTAMSERMDPEQVRNLINACFQDLVPIITNHGGTVDKFIGDEIMALFGAPVAHENDPERAVRAAFAMQEQLARFNAGRGTELGMHFGINTGLAIAGDVGTTGRHDYSVMGDSVNLASRLADLAERGEILVGPETYRLTSHAFEFAAMRLIPVKGKADPIAVARAVALRTSAASARGSDAGRRVESVLIGRDREVATLLECSERVLQGQGGIVGVLGEAGLGKSRLVAEVQRRLTTRGLLYLEGRALSIGQTLPYWPILDVIRAYAGISESDDEAAAFAKLERRSRALFGADVAEILPYLATLLGLDVRDEALAVRVKYLSGEAMGSQILLTARRFVERLCQDHPLFLVIEDLHWADEASVELLEHLMSLVETVPLLLCLVSRPDEAAPGGRLLEAARAKYHLHYTEIALAPLGPIASAALLRSLLGTGAVSPQLRETILTRTEGNPFFLEEVIRALIDLGGLVRDPADATWQATAKAEIIVIPETIQGVIMARIDRLHEDLKQVLKLAAVIGRTFFYRVLQSIATADRELDQHLAELQSLELIREKSRLPELEYFFKHALAQEATYESILLERRRQLHRQVAECIEALFAHRLEEFYGLLAYHYARAETWEKAQAYLFKVGDQAGRLAADAEALAHYQLAMAAYERAFGGRWDPLQRASLERKMGEALFRRGDHDQALKYLQRALGHLGGSPLPTARWRVWAQIARQALRQARLRLLSARPTRDDVGERVRILEVVIWIDFFRDHPEHFLLHTLSLANDAEQHGLVIETVKAFAALGMIGNLIPLPRVSAYYHRRAVLLADEVAHPVAVAYAYLGLAFHEHQCLGTWPAAVEHYRRAAAAYQSVGDLRRWGGATVGAAFVSSLQGDFTRGLELSNELVRVGPDAGDDQLLGWGEANVGYALLCQRGALGEAREHLEKAADLLKSIPDQPSLAITLGLVGQCYLREHRLNEALAVSEECWRLVVDRGLRGFLAALAVGYAAEVALAAAESSGRDEGAPTAYRKARAMCRAALRQATISRTGAPIAYRSQGTYHWLRGRPKRAFRWWQRSVAVAEALGARYDLARTHLEIGRRTGDRAHLEQAEALCAEIGARSDLAEVRELLRGR